MTDSTRMNRYSPDVLAAGLDVIFCGINPATTAVADGHNFSNRSNRFWDVLYQAGFTEVRLRPEDEQGMLTYGCGITAVVERPTPRATDISPDEFLAARPAFEQKIRRYRPRVVAFLGKRAVSSMLAIPHISFGRQACTFADAPAWVLPNPSGLNRRYPLAALVAAYTELRIALRDGRSQRS
jgi:double-stranded uracil-DNA glycosylase